MRNNLTRCSTTVLQDIDSFATSSLLYSATNFRQGSSKLSSSFLWEIKRVCVSCYLWDDQCMTRGDREGIKKGENVFILKNLEARYLGSQYPREDVAAVVHFIFLGDLEGNEPRYRSYLAVA